jgi:hypothetical protein
LNATHSRGEHSSHIPCEEFPGIGTASDFMRLSRGDLFAIIVKCPTLLCLITGEYRGKACQLGRFWGRMGLCSLNRLIVRTQTVRTIRTGQRASTRGRGVTGRSTITSLSGAISARSAADGSIHGPLVLRPGSTSRKSTG